MERHWLCPVSRWLALGCLEVVVKSLTSATIHQHGLHRFICSRSVSISQQQCAAARASRHGSSRCGACDVQSAVADLATYNFEMSLISIISRLVGLTAHTRIIAVACPGVAGAVIVGRLSTACAGRRMIRYIANALMALSRRSPPPSNDGGSPLVVGSRGSRIFSIEIPNENFYIEFFYPKFLILIAYKY